MQADRIADEARLAGSARGLGVCDVLRVELAAVQRAGLESEMAARTAALETSLRGSHRDRVGRDDDAREAGEELRLLARMRASVEESAFGPIALSGPAGMVLELVDRALAAAVADLDVTLGESLSGTQTGAAPVARLEAAAAWIATVLDCHAVEAYCFEPGVDPMRTW